MSAAEQGTETPATEPTAYVLPAAVRQQLRAYLGSRPYDEVAGGVRVLETLAPLPATASA